MLFSVQVASSLPSNSCDRMSLSTLFNNQDPMHPKLSTFHFPQKDDRRCGFQSSLSDPMARGCKIECCEPEAVDNPGREPVDKRQGASPRIIESMKLESNRLNSFANRWPLTYIEPTELASVGLFYLGLNDSVQCAFCHGIISDWEEGDLPLREHVKHFPMCPFLLNCEVGNVPISGVNGRQKWQVQPSHSECRIPEEPISDSVRTGHSFRPKHPAMGSFDKRLASFENWPSSSPMMPSQLAEAGLFYSDNGDITTCFCCGGSLGSWCPGDSPWSEHARHFPECSYVKCIKGSQFAESARQPSNIAAVEQCLNSPSYVEPAVSADVQITEDTKMENEATGERETSHPSEGQAKFLCKICMEETSRAVFVPCGHSLTCLKCASNLDRCPMCRKQIQTSIRLFFDD